MPVSKLKLAMAAAAFSLSLAPGVAVAGNACDFYSATSYGGEKFTLYKGHVLIAGEGVSASSVVANGNDFQQFNDPRWKGNVASVRVQSGCTAWLNANAASSQGYSSDTTDVGHVGSRAGGYACTCN